MAIIQDGFYLEKVEDCDIINGFFTPPPEINCILPKACYGNSKLTQVVLTPNIQEVSSYAFAGCRNLISINLPDNIHLFDLSSILNCPNLEEITFPSKFKFIDFHFDVYRIEELYDFTKNLMTKSEKSQKSLLNLIKYYPTICLYIQDCDRSFKANALEQVRLGMEERIELAKETENFYMIEKDIKLIPKLKEWKNPERYKKEQNMPRTEELKRKITELQKY